MKPTLALFLLASAGVATFVLLHGRKAEQPPQQTTNEPLAPVMDKGLTPAEVQSVVTALAIETNPANLNAFAQTFEPDFPIAAHLLKARAAVLKPATTFKDF